MTENDLLRQKFKALRIPKIAKFIRAINSQFSAVTWAKVLKRNEPVDLRTLLIMTQELGFSEAELRSVLIAREEKIIAEMVSPIHFSPTEQMVINKFRKFSSDPIKTKLIMDLLDHLERPPENFGGKTPKRRKTDKPREDEENQGTLVYF